MTLITLNFFEVKICIYWDSYKIYQGKNNRYFILRYDLCVNIHIYFVNSESSEQVECAIFITFINLKNCVYEYIRINKRHVVSILLFLCLLYECASKKH